LSIDLHLFRSGNAQQVQSVGDDGANGICQLEPGLQNVLRLALDAVGIVETVETAGYRAMLYFNRRQAALHMDISALKEYEFWLAAYTDRMAFPYRIDMWQYTNTGRVPGIVGDVDINVYFPKTPDT